MRNIKVIILLSIIFLLLSSCWEDKRFYVDNADIFIDIERLSIERFRIYIYGEIENRGKDYIDIDYDMSDMPTIQLSIPKNENNKIFVIDRWHDVEDICSSELNFVLLSPERVKNGELVSIEKMERLERTLTQIDSVMDSIHSITIQLNPRLKNLYLWENGKYEYRRMINSVIMIE